MDGQAGGVQSIDLDGPVHYVDFAGPGVRSPYDGERPAPPVRCRSPLAPPDLVDRSVLLIDRRTDVAGMDRAFVTAARSLLWALLWVLTRASTFRATMAAITRRVLLTAGIRYIASIVRSSR